MIEGVSVRELPSSPDAAGLAVRIWEGENGPGELGAASCRTLFPGVVEAWIDFEEDVQRIACLLGMIKLVLCDRREGSPTAGEVMELFLGEYRFREVTVPPGVLMGWKAVGDRAAMLLLALEGNGGKPRVTGLDEAAVPYDWDIVMQ